jgi:hypothetical protein
MGTGTFSGSEYGVIIKHAACFFPLGLKFMFHSLHILLTEELLDTTDKVKKQLYLTLIVLIMRMVH